MIKSFLIKHLNQKYFKFRNNGCISVFIIISIFNLSLSGQISEDARKYNLLISKGYWCNFNKEYKKSNEFLSEAMLIHSPIEGVSYTIAKNYFHLNEQNKTDDYLKKCFQEGLILQDMLEDGDDTLFTNYINKNKERIEGYYQTERKTYFNNINVDLLVELEKLKAVDQHVRYPLFNINEFDTIGEKFQAKASIYADSINEIKLMKIIKKYGTDIYIQAGLGNMYKIKLMMWHHIAQASRKKDSSSVKFYLDFNIKAINELKLPSHYYSSLYDVAFARFTPNKNDGSFYGTGADIGNVYIKINKIEEIDLRRAKLGQLSLYENSKMRKLKLPEDYKIPFEFKNK